LKGTYNMLGECVYFMGTDEGLEFWVSRGKTEATHKDAGAVDRMTMRGASPCG
jgi:hypothetical protein